MRISSWKLGTLLLHLFLSVVAFSQDPNPLDLDSTSTTALSVDDKNEYQRQWEAYLRRVESWLRTHDASDNQRTEIARLFEKAQTQLNYLKYAPGEKWEEEVRRLNQAIVDLKNKHYRAVAKSPDERSEYEKELKAQLVSYRLELDGLKYKMPSLAAEEKKILQDSLQSMESDYQRAAEKIDQMGPAAANQWARLKMELDEFQNKWEEKKYEEVQRTTSEKL